MWTLQIRDLPALGGIGVESSRINIVMLENVRKCIGEHLIMEQHAYAVGGGIRGLGAVVG